MVEENSKENKRRAQKPAFKFHMIGLNVGDTVVFDELILSVTVASDDKVEYQGRLWSLPVFSRQKISKTLRGLIKGLSTLATRAKR